MKTFEKFLEEVHSRLYPMVLDDDLPDSLDNWLSNLDVQEVMDWGELYGKESFLLGKEEVINQL